MGEITQSWRQLHIEENHNHYSSPNIISVLNAKEDETERACRIHMEEANVYKVFC
jgi:hypothetical protein